jgi:hypothetical protein
MLFFQDVPSIIGDSARNIKLLVCRPDRREYQAYLVYILFYYNNNKTKFCLFC